jgi:2-dehydro-3-deoxyphosphogluconate aldolase / (4S)-4-hydroxy-2-oxoglutarate aldolase
VGVTATGGTAQAAIDVLAISPVIPVVVVEDARQAVPLARALARGGVGVVEITLRTRAGLSAVERVAAEVPEIRVGAGTVTTPSEVEAVRRAGASFIVLPGSPERLLSAALDAGLPLLPGAGTMTEMMRLAEAGLEVLKFFPAGPSGGADFLSAVAGPLPHLRFCPTGGITQATAGSYLRLANVPCVGGSWLTPADAVAAGDWARIESLAAEAAALRPGPA